MRFACGQIADHDAPQGKCERVHALSYIREKSYRDVFKSLGVVSERSPTIKSPHGTGGPAKTTERFYTGNRQRWPGDQKNNQTPFKRTPASLSPLEELPTGSTGQQLASSGVAVGARMLQGYFNLQAVFVKGNRYFRVFVLVLVAITPRAAEGSCSRSSNSQRFWCPYLL